MKRDSCALAGGATAEEYPQCYPAYEWNGASEEKECIPLPAATAYNSVSGQQEQWHGLPCKYRYTEQAGPDKDQYWASQVLGFDAQVRLLSPSLSRSRSLSASLNY